VVELEEKGRERGCVQAPEDGIDREEEERI